MTSELDAFQQHLLDIFKAEARQRVDKLRTYIGEMANAHSPEAAESAYREVHSLKAAAALVELGEMADLSQAMEQAFATIRQNPAVLRLHLGSLLESSGETLARGVEALERGKITAGEREQTRRMTVRLNDALAGLETKSGTMSKWPRLRWRSGSEKEPNDPAKDRQ